MKVKAAGMGLVLLAMTLLIGCSGEAKTKVVNIAMENGENRETLIVDARSPQRLFQSVWEAAKGPHAHESQLLEQALLALFGGSINLSNKQPTMSEDILKRRADRKFQEAFHQKTVEEIIVTGSKINRRNSISRLGSVESEIAALEKKRKKHLAHLATLESMTIKELRFFQKETGYGANIPTISMRLKNQGDIDVASVDFKATHTTGEPDRQIELPDVTLELEQPLRAGEERTVRIRPNPFSQWGYLAEVGYRLEDMQIELNVLRVTEHLTETVFHRHVISEADKDQLESLHEEKSRLEQFIQDLSVRIELSPYGVKKEQLIQW